MAGGPRQNSDLATLQLVAEVMQGGAAGILFGRAIFQADNPLAVLKACRAIIHDGATVDAARALM
jgi:DhnA family fructose-bisphosphate aldolase class Ia